MSDADNVADILEELSRTGDAARLEGMARYGINTSRAFGNSMPAIRSLAKTIGKDHTLALALWRTEIHDARLLCAFVDDASAVRPDQMDTWAGDFNSWDLTDQVCNNLFSRTPYAAEKIMAWSAREEEFVRRAAFALIASLAVHSRTLGDEQFVGWMSLITAAADDERNFVKKAVNWALRQIGKRSLALRESALTAAEELTQRESTSARWIGRDALRELHRPDIIERLQKKSTQ